MKNNPIAFDELGNQIAKLDGSPLPQNNNWKEEFDNEFGDCTCYEADQDPKCVKCRGVQFISDLRKKDEEELIKMLPESEHSLSHIYCEEMREQGFQGCKVKVKQLIKDYYAK